MDDKYLIGDLMWEGSNYANVEPSKISTEKAIELQLKHLQESEQRFPHVMARGNDAVVKILGQRKIK